MARAASWPTHRALHVHARRLPQRHFTALRQSLALALAHFLALERDRLHPLAKRVRRNQRHRQRQHGRARRDGGEQHRQRVDIEKLRDQRGHSAAIRNRN